MTQLTVFGVYTLRTRRPDSAETLSSLCILHAGKHLHQLHQLIRPSTIHSQFPRLPIHPSNQLAHVQVKASSYPVLPAKLLTFYRAMHFSAKHGIAIACRLSVCPSTTLVDCDHIGWNSSKIISPLVSPGCSFFETQTSRVYSKGNTLDWNFRPNRGRVLKKWLSEYEKL